MALSHLVLRYTMNTPRYRLPFDGLPAPFACLLNRLLSWLHAAAQSTLASLAPTRKPYQTTSIMGDDARMNERPTITNTVARRPKQDDPNHGFHGDNVFEAALKLNGDEIDSPRRQRHSDVQLRTGALYHGTFIYRVSYKTKRHWRSRH